MPRKKIISSETTSNKKETIKVRQSVLKNRFLEKIQEIPFVSSAAPFVGIDRSTYYRWRNSDSKFAREVDKQQLKGREKINDVIESVLLKKAQGGDITSIIFWLKHNHQRYTHRVLIKYEDSELSEKEKRKIEKLLKIWEGRPLHKNAFNPRYKQEDTE